VHSTIFHLFESNVIILNFDTFKFTSPQETTDSTNLNFTIKLVYTSSKQKLRAVEPEPVKKPEEEDPQATPVELPPNAKNNASSANAKKVEPPPPPPYRYAMPTHAVYSPPPIKVKS
jgi:hypothetical protein